MIREMNTENNGLKTFIKRMRSKIKKMYNGDKYGYGEDLEQLEYYARKKELIVYEKESEILAITFISKEIEEDSWILGEFEGVVYDIIAIDYDIKVDFLNEM